MWTNFLIDWRIIIKRETLNIYTTAPLPELKVHVVAEQHCDFAYLLVDMDIWLLRRAACGVPTQELHVFEDLFD